MKLIEEIKHQRANEEWSDVLPTREVEQEILDTLDQNNSPRLAALPASDLQAIKSALAKVCAL
ncbi:MAG TPA: hypothetical protein VFW05_00110 [Verrucomicrobiae bacterium]|nr:hypothetical protein [Verrucomicrobiae bacterium]